MAERYIIEARPESGYTISSDPTSGYEPFAVDAEYLPLQVQAEGDSDSWLDIGGFVDTLKEVVTDKNFLIGGAVGAVVAIGIGMMLAPKPRMGSRVGSRVRRRRR